MILNQLKQEGQNIRRAYQRKSTSNPNKDYYFMHRNTGDTESVIVEYGFLDSTKDDVSQIKNNWKKYAEAVVQAVIEYIGYTGSNIENNIYTVQKGDTLYSISKKYGIPVSEIKKLNNLKSDILSIGQQLSLSTTSNGTYVVKAGDTLYNISKKYGISVDKLKELNGLTSNVLSIGQVLSVSPNEEVEVVGDTYIVKAGDTLYAIAQEYGLDVELLKTMNNLTSNLLSVGQVLYLNGNTDYSSNLYTVQAGDTLYSIAKRYGISVDTLKSMNGLTNNLLTIGESLIIP